MNAEPKVFISYRREETSGHAGRLYDVMAARFGDPNVFMDVDLDPGVDFVKRITDAVGACRVLLVMMGPRWATLSSGEAGPRIAEPGDFVHLEVETALRRPEVTVIPLLVAGARMPDPKELPEGVRPIARRNALELSDLRWRYDVGRLIATMDELLAGAGAMPAVRPEQPPAERAGASSVPATARVLVPGVLLALVSVLIARWLADPIVAKNYSTDGGKIAATMLKPTIAWAALGVALAVWLSFVRGEGRLLARRALLGLAVGALAGALGGAIVALAQYLPEENRTFDEVSAFTVMGTAASGAVIGALVGALWAPRNIATGLLSGLAAGALVKLLWNGLDWLENAGFEVSFGLGIQCVLIVGLVLVALFAASGAWRSTEVAHA